MKGDDTVNELDTRDRPLSTSRNRGSIGNEESIDYEKLIEENSAQLEAIQEEFDIFISHASAGEGAFPDEKDFVKTLYQILKGEYGKRVYLDLFDNDSYQYDTIIRAIQLSKYGVFVCSSRYVKIFLGRRTEPYKKEFDIINQEINLFVGKERDLGIRIIPVKFGVSDEAYRQKGPFPYRFRISIDDESRKDFKEKAAFVAAKIIDRINDIESNINN